MRMSTSPPKSRASPFEFRTETLDDATIVRCSGHLTFDVSAHFKVELRRLIPQTKRMVIDSTDLDYMDSSGLGAVMSLYVSARKAGCEFHLINFNQRVRQLLEMTNVISIFETCGKSMIKLP